MSTANRKTLRLDNARLVLPDRVVEGALVIEDGRIASMLHDEASPNTTAAEQIDLNGSTVFPGFIDVHIHGAVGVDTLAATTADLIQVSKFLTGQGVTAWLPTLVPASLDDYERATKAITDARNQQLASGANDGARILGVHYEGPFVNPMQCGALRPQFLRSYSGESDLNELPRLKGDEATHMMTVAPEVAGGAQLIKELSRRGWIVSIGHTRATSEVLDLAFANGARHMTHFMNAMAPLHHRAPGPVAWGLLRDEVTCDVIADGVHLDRQTLRLLLKLKTPERLLLISDAIAAAGCGDGDYEIWGETITVRDGCTSNASGHIAGSVITMREAVQMMAPLGVSEIDLARMAATNPARLLGIDDDCGSIEEGKRADLVALNVQGEVVMTLIGGVKVMSDE